MSDLIVVLCTCPNETVAKHIASEAVQKKLAACVNIIHGIASIYSWQDEIQCDTEVQMVIKTKSGVVQELRELVHSLHPYDIPEWLVIDNVEASSEYADWIRSVVK